MPYKLLLANLFLMSFINPLYAQIDYYSTLTLEELMNIKVFTADRSIRDLNTVAANVIVITKNEIENSAAKNIPDLFRNKSGILVQSLFENEKRTNVSIRGFGFQADQSMVVLVDGRKLNSTSSFSIDWTTIPIERVQRIEIVKGGKSVIYGDKAISGIINIITKHGYKIKEFFAGIKMGSYNYQKPYFSYSNIASINDGRLSYSINGSHHKTDGYRENEAFNNKTIGFGLNFEKNNYNIDFSGGFHDADNLRPGFVDEATFNTNPKSSQQAIGSFSEDDSFYFHSLSTYSLDKAALHLNLDYSKSNDFVKYVNRTLNRTRLIDRSNNTIRIAPKFDYQFKMSNVHNDLSIGYDYQRIEHYVDDSAATFSDIQMLKSHHDFFIKNTSHFISSDVFMDIGYRKSLIKESGTVAASKKYDLDSYNLSLLKRINGKSKVFISYDKSYRTSLSYELSPFDIGTWTADKPAIADQYEIGFSYFFNASLKTQMGLFNIKIKDEMLYETYERKIVNIGDTKRNGLEFELSYNHDNKYQFFFNYTYLVPEFTSGKYEGNIIPNIPEHTFDMGLNYSINTNLNMSINTKWVDEKVYDDDLNNIYELNDEYSITDVAINYQIKKFKIKLGVNNLFDENYSDYSYYRIYPPPGDTVYFPRPTRNFFAQFEYEM